MSPQRREARGIRTPNLRVWNPTRCRCAIASCLGFNRLDEKTFDYKKNIFGFFFRRTLFSLEEKKTQDITGYPKISNGTKVWSCFHIDQVEPFGVIRKNWNDTEKISMAPAQGWHAQIENVSLFFLLWQNKCVKKKHLRRDSNPQPPD